MPREKLTFPSAAGHTLTGTLELPAGRIRGAAVFAHCFTCSQNSKGATYIARALARRGIATLKFDFTGLGGSEGEFGDSGFLGDVADVESAAREMAKRFETKVLLVGHSLGGAAVLAAGATLECVYAIATVNAPSDVPHALDRIDGDLDAIESDGKGTVTIGGRPFTISRDFIDHTREADLGPKIDQVRVPLIVLHSPTDTIVGIEHAKAIFERAHHPKSFVGLEGANHLMTDQRDADFASEMIAGWAARFMPDAPIDRPEKGVVARTGHGKWGTEILTPLHDFVADEPRRDGGDEMGPTPYDLLLAGLGSCTAMTIKFYAEREGLPFEGVEVDLWHERDHARDCDHCEGESRVQAIHRTLRFAGDLPVEVLDKLTEVADKCPVHRTLEGHLHIHTERAE
ncbi:bifunctional alpha/beta hydrolase/OsmC family protein [Pseudoblastomonas halimionae]|uniref:Alpha/beta fold hydrolase n=1 Tax=Alteriqipengyuania halimionae TaxID=1926630 RepID=A0A6I4U655_9SPHN|nr:alpha/beta fold hydrolase [Alteriqipengyuania halimionae]MXP11186.1 alpha/beta fold hydrolase [Alteriqipengyuania halimionae]